MSGLIHSGIEEIHEPENLPKLIEATPAVPQAPEVKAVSSYKTPLVFIQNASYCSPFFVNYAT